VGNILKGVKDRTIRVIGHTDNVPISNRHFPSNWELSASRAINVAKLIQRYVEEGKDKNEIIRIIKRIIEIRDKYAYKRHEFRIDTKW